MRKLPYKCQTPKLVREEDKFGSGNHHESHESSYVPHRGACNKLGLICTNMEMHPLPRKPVAELDNEFPAYQRLASFMNRDPSYLVFRRFNELNLRNLLVLQHEIGELEQRLNPLPSSSDITTAPEYKSLMSTVQEKLDRYSQCLQSFKSHF